MTLPDIPIDGNWVDIGSLTLGAVYGAIKTIIRAGQGGVGKIFALEFANGASLFPLLVMVLSPVSSSLLQGLLQSSKLTLATAGLFALFAIVSDGTPSQKSRKEYFY